MDKDKILEVLANKPLYQLDRMRDEKLLELKEVLAKLHKAKDEDLVKRHEKRKQLLIEGNSFSKVENMLRSDEELFKLKRLVGEYRAVKNKVKLELEIITNYYWKAKN